MIWFTMASCLELPGPTLKDLMKKVDSSYEEISRALIARSVGFFISSFVGGFLCDRFPKHVDIFISVAMFVNAVTTVSIPWCHELIPLAILMHFQGLSEGVLNTGGMTTCLNLWGEKVSAPMHSTHFGWGIGGLFSTQIARPFLSPDVFLPEDVKSNETVVFQATTSSLSANITLDATNLSRIEYAYAISATLALLMSIVFLLFYILPPPRGFQLATIPKKNDIKAIFHPASCAQDNTMFGLIMFPLLLWFYMHITGGERAVAKFLFSFAKDSELLFNNDQATLALSLHWIFYTIGRGLAIVVAKFVPPRYMLIGEISMNIISGSVLSALGYKNEIVFWIFNALLGLFLAPVFPSGVSWANRYLDMSGIAVAIVLLGASGGGFVYQWITGALFDAIGPNALMYVMTGDGLLLAQSYVTLQIIASRQGDRFTKDSDAKEKHVVGGVKETSV
ncbi:sodium-dependent glucose transporter 1-like [Lingula anatina]|uniref:Sodium-dependent glucose transporter 1-like n=1 Tax=Lingula anatina TaxID=7574 RepID=A0A1S3J6U5_LINAN|nr:sodium-dependent glucose transporter 1-like [Lingula anatina]|eukprot:XP_013406115.1 sodium-dependent glucose transporter 1-like [Lingula anatina]